MSRPADTIPLSFWQYFSKPFFNELPDETTDVVLHHGDDIPGVCAKMKKRSNDKVAFITMGWLRFSRRHRFKDGDLCIFSITKGAYMHMVRVCKV
jgi:hypothetical protein